MRRQHGVDGAVGIGQEVAGGERQEDAKHESWRQILGRILPVHVRLAHRTSPFKVLDNLLDNNAIFEIS